MGRGWGISVITARYPARDFHLPSENTTTNLTAGKARDALFLLGYQFLATDLCYDS